MSSLIICLPTAADSASASYDYALTADARVLGDHASVPLSLLPPAEQADEVVAVVPASLLSWHAVVLPKGLGRGSPRLRAVLENLLEERLLDEPAHLHLALAPGLVTGEPVWVAVCNRSWLMGHIHALEVAGRPVTRIVPEFEPVTGPLELTGVGELDLPELIAVGQGVDAVLRLPLNPANLALLPKIGSDEEVLVFSEPSVVALAEQLLQANVELRTRQQRWVNASRSTWDLAQFDLVNSGRARTYKRLSGMGRELLYAPGWRPARQGAALFLLVNLLGLNVWAWKEQSALQKSRESIQAKLTQTFPQVKVVVDAPLQMEREVAALRLGTGATTGQDLESILGVLGAAIDTKKTAAAIDFSAGEAKIKGLQLSAPETSSLMGRLKAQGYAFRTESDTVYIKQDITSGAP